jgi:hypothetical protein
MLSKLICIEIKISQSRVLVIEQDKSGKRDYFMSHLVLVQLELCTEQ